MRSNRLRILGIGLATLSLPLLTPTLAAAWWHHGWGGYPGCCWGPRVVIGVAPPAYVAPPPPIYAVPPPVAYSPYGYPAGRVWIPRHWNGWRWIRGHWRYY